MVMRLLDLFCGAGGAAVGYARCGFIVTGVDNRPQPHYPFHFIQDDALHYVRLHGHEYNAIHASPPCQRYSCATPKSHRARHPDLIAPTRAALIATNKPYIIENVPGARCHLHNPITLCGSMFGLRLRRHRLFEIKPHLPIVTPPCNHTGPIIVMNGRTRLPNGRSTGSKLAECRAALEIDWMTRDEIDQAIPPAYTHFIGCYLMAYLLTHATTKGAETP
jgi:DNA (cytosine-5)-methyltransferase 1